MTNDKKNGFKWLEWGQIVRMQNRNIVAREKIKFKTKVKRGRKKVKWSKRREEQNMKFEIS